jgi:hypothetical protein
MRQLPLDLTCTRNRHYTRNTIVLTSAIQGGLKQGKVLSLSLFNFALEYVIKNAEASQKGLKLNGRHQLLFYADDINLFNEKIHTMRVKTHNV